MKVYAHRGYSGRYPENTMLSFQKAAETGCDGIELDVQLTRDGTVVVIHDEAVDRTTDGTGLVKDYTFEELRKLDAGTIKGGRYGFCPVPSFEEYCEWASQYGFVTNVEIKTGVYYYEDIEEKTLEIIKKYHLEDRVMFSSFNHVSLLKAKELEPDIACGILVDDELGNAGYYCSQYGFECYHPNGAKLSGAVAESCARHGIKINAWTINDMALLERLGDLNCSGAITNYPGICRAWQQAIQK